MHSDLKSLSRSETSECWTGEVTAMATRGCLRVPFPPVARLDGAPQPVSSAPPRDSIPADGTSEK